MRARRLLARAAALLRPSPGCCCRCRSLTGSSSSSRFSRRRSRPGSPASSARARFPASSRRKLSVSVCLAGREPSRAGRAQISSEGRRYGGLPGEDGSCCCAPAGSCRAAPRSWSQSGRAVSRGAERLPAGRGPPPAAAGTTHGRLRAPERPAANRLPPPPAALGEEGAGGGGRG